MWKLYFQWNKCLIHCSFLKNVQKWLSSLLKFLHFLTNHLVKKIQFFGPLNNFRSLQHSAKKTIVSNFVPFPHHENCKKICESLVIHLWASSLKRWKFELMPFWHLENFFDKSWCLKSTPLPLKKSHTYVYLIKQIQYNFGCENDTCSEINVLLTVWN